ncbi:MAG: FAD-binding oxidoreductase [Cyanobacteriota bacterium]|nr:FAD-binding oxidoreductase [Cyanobacteriota bacterium]
MITPEPNALQELVRHLHQQATPWLPSGLGSRLDWGPPVAAESELVSTARLDRVLEFNPGDFTITVQAGTPFQVVQRALAEHRQWLALDWPWGSGPGGEGSGSIGGLVARGLAGGFRQRYLGVRDQLIGIGLIRSDGTAARAGGKVVKNVAGYDLMRLLCGSWGSLALITEVTLRTLPVPPERRGLWLSGEAAPLVALSRWLLNSGFSPERLDWLRLADAEPGLLVSLASISSQTLDEQVAGITAQAETLRCRCALLSPEELQQRLAQGQGSAAAAAWLLRIGVASMGCRELLEEPALASIPITLGAGSGLAMAWAGAADLPAYRVEALRRRCQALGGFLTVLRQPQGSTIPAWLDAPSRPLIEAVKRQFDPKQQLARGRLPGVTPARSYSASTR